MTHWMILPVVLPAAVAPLIVLVARNDLFLQRVLSMAAALLLLVVSLGLAVSASGGDPQLYRLGDWPAPFGIVLVLDRLSALMLVLTALLALPVLLHAILTNWDARGRHFHALFHFQLLGICGAFLTGDAFNLFVFFEVLLIASYGLMIHGGGGARLRAGVQYIAFNLIGSTLFLFALATIYAVTGTLNMADLAVKAASLPEGDGALLRAGAAMLLLVFAIKGALVPMQFWLPGTYAMAPGPTAALFAILTKVGAYGAIRMGELVFPAGAGPAGGLFAEVLWPAALVTLALGSLAMLGAATLPRLAAFTTIASMGTLFLVVAAATPGATTAALYYAIHSTLAGAALFLIADLIAARRTHTRLDQALPPMRQGGVLAWLFLVAAVAAAGLPPLSGFLGKVLVLQAIGPAQALAWTVVLAGSLLSVLAFARAGSVLFWKAHATGDPPYEDAAAAGLGLSSLVPAGLILAALVALTAGAGPLTLWLEGAAAQVHDPAAFIRANDLPGEP